MKKRFLSILTAAALCMSTVGVSVLADEEEYEDFTEGVTLTCNGEVVTEKCTFDYDSDGIYETAGFIIWSSVDETREYTFDLFDDDGVAAEDTVVTLISIEGADSYGQNAQENVSISANTVTVGGYESNGYGWLGLIVSSKSLGVNTQVELDYYEDVIYSDGTKNTIVCCNGVEATKITGHWWAYPEVSTEYSIDMTIGETYELKFVDRETGEALSIDDDTNLDFWYNSLGKHQLRT